MHGFQNSHSRKQRGIDGYGLGMSRSGEVKITSRSNQHHDKEHCGAHAADYGDGQQNPPKQDNSRQAGLNDAHKM
jgi:hypothetical protein